MLETLPVRISAFFPPVGNQFQTNFLAQIPQIGSYFMIGFPGSSDIIEGLLNFGLRHSFLAIMVLTARQL